MNRMIYCILLLLFNVQFCRENSAGDAAPKEQTQNVSENSENIKKKVEVLNISDKRLTGFYSLRGSEWSDIVENKNPYTKNALIRSQFKSSENSLYFKFVGYREAEYPETYRVNFKEAEKENEYYAEYNGKRIFKALFIKEWNNILKLDEFYIKFYELNAEADPNVFQGLPARATSLHQPLHVKSFGNLIDAELDLRISQCFEEPSPEGREWPNCKPPGYNNLK